MITTIKADLLRILKGRAFTILACIALLFLLLVFFVGGIGQSWSRDIDLSDRSTFEARIAADTYERSIMVILIVEYINTVVGTTIMSSAFIREKVHKGLIRNQLMSGTSKTAIYLSYILTLAAVPFLFLLMSNLCFGILALITHGKMLFSITTYLINQAVILFSGIFAGTLTVLISTIFRKAAISIILSGLLLFVLIELPMKLAEMPVSEDAIFLDYVDADMPEKMDPDIDLRFDGCDYRITYTVNGEGHDWQIPEEMDKTKIFLFKTISKADPLAYTVHLTMTSREYYTASGLPQITILSCIFWSGISALIGRAIILKKDI